MRKRIIFSLAIIFYMMGCFYFKNHFYGNTYYKDLKLSYLDARQAREKIDDYMILGPGSRRTRIDQSSLQTLILNQNFYLWPWNCWHHQNISNKLDHNIYPEKVIINDPVNLEKSKFNKQFGNDLIVKDSNLDSINLNDYSSFKLEFNNRVVTLPPALVSEIKAINASNESRVRDQLQMFLMSRVGEPFKEQTVYRNYHSTYQGDVKIAPGSLGCKKEIKKVLDQIIEDLKLGASCSRLFLNVGSLQEAWPDWVEVDLNCQMMTIYKDQKISMQVPIVSGRPGSETQEGAYQVWAKESPAILKGINPHDGSDYRQEVKYWICMDNEGLGIHDANWQLSFGGQTYRDQGSLGCINVPPSRMLEIYRLIELGMPIYIL